jgi:hypothetical protein
VFSRGEEEGEGAEEERAEPPPSQDSMDLLRKQLITVSYKILIFNFAFELGMTHYQKS